jgi:VanZ family protein
VNRLLKFYRVVFWLCFVGLTGLALSPAPYLPPMDIFNWWDKAQHAIGYGTLMASALLAYPKASKFCLAALLCLHGCLIEVLQYLSGYRFGDWQDALADGVGVIVALVVFVIVSNLAFMVRPLGHDASAEKEGLGAAKNSKLSATTTSEENTN